MQSHLVNRRQDILRIITSLKPGEYIEFSRQELYRILVIEIHPAFSRLTSRNPLDGLMESIIGSAYEYSYREIFDSDNIRFERRLKPLENGLRTYVSFDRRYLFNEREDGLFELKK